MGESLRGLYSEPVSHAADGLNDGAASVSSPHGAPLLFHVASAGETPGHDQLLHGRTHTASAQALGPVTTLVVPRRTCLELLEAEPASLLAYARDLANIVHILDESLADLVFLDLERRLGRLFARAPSDNDRVTLSETQGGLAALLGSTRPSLNQALSRLAERGLVVVESPRVVRIVDRAALSAFISNPGR